MLKIIIPIFIAAAGILLLLGCRPLIRGIADDMLVSPARPVLAVKPDSAFRLTDAARADVLVPIRNVSGNKASALLYYALYAHSNKNARMTVLFGDVADPYYWEISPNKPKETIRQKDLKHNGVDGTATTYILEYADDPWREPDEHAPWNGSMLVRQWTFRLFLLHFNVIIEYREPLPQSDLPAADNLPMLAAFEKRADEAFSLLRKEQSARIPRPSKRLPYPPAHLKRGDLAAYVGEVREEAKF